MEPRWWPMLLCGLLALLGETTRAEPWLRVISPGQASATSQVPLLEVTGQAGSRTIQGHDLVIALDLSDSTLAECGVDLDGDGPMSRSDPALIAELKRRNLFPARLAARLEGGLDFDDTILAAELEAAGALIERLDPRRFRVGLVVFSNDAVVAAPLETRHAALGPALDEIRFVAPAFLRGTNLMAAIDEAQAMLAPPETPPSGRELSLVLLTDGAPTLPLKGGPGTRTLEAARAAGSAGIRIFPFAIGPEAQEAKALLDAIAGASRGRAYEVGHPSEVATALRTLDLVDLAGVEIWNVTTGSPARASRVFPDGSFDGFVRLVPGLNRIRVEATHVDGTVHRVERSIRLDPRGADGQAALLREKMDALRSRTREIEMWAEMEAQRRRQRKLIEIDGLDP